MVRAGFHLEIEEGKRDAYREKHELVPAELVDAYLDSAADIETYSVFEKDGHVFGYLELANLEALKDVMEHSQAQAEWDEEMDPILAETAGADMWMDEVYRMV